MFLSAVNQSFNSSSYRNSFHCPTVLIQQMLFRCTWNVRKQGPLKECFVKQVLSSNACQQNKHPSAVEVIDDKCPSGVAV